MRLSILLVLGLVLAGMGCVASTNPPPASNGNNTTPPSGDGSLVHDLLTVSLKDVQFNPGTLNVAVGGTVKFVNNDGFTHDLRVYNSSSEPYPQTTIAPGQTIEVTISEAGTYTMECARHLPGMTGTIIVK